MLRLAILQELRYVGNVQPPASSGFDSIEIVAGTQQSDGDSCGVHAIMNMRAAAEHDGPWEHLKLFEEASCERDELWRQILANECLQGHIECYSAIAEMSAAVE